MTPKREIIQIRKNTGQLFFDAESIYEISKPYLKVVAEERTDGRKEGRTSPKQYDPSTFSKLGAAGGIIKKGLHV